MNRINKQVLLKELSHYKIGGPIEYFLDIHSLKELKDGLFLWKKNCEKIKLNWKKIFIIGEGTNILFHDKGFSGLIIRNSIKYIKKEGLTLEIGAGIPVSELNDYCIKNGLSGLEWAGGLPGTIGGAVFGNAGAFGGEIKDNIVSVTSYNFSVDKTIERKKENCLFGYRNSIFKKNKNKEIILSVKIEFKRGDKNEIRKQTEDKIDYRKQRQPLEYPNIGSTFKNIDLAVAPTKLIDEVKDQIKTDPFPVIPVAYLISLAGLKGKRDGDAMISEKHPNFIVNLGNAKSANVKRLIRLVKRVLKSRFGVEPETEIIKAGR